VSTQEELTRRQLWARTRLVVIDTETTGLEADARILSLAVFVVENGVTVDSWSTLVNPGGRIGATHIHGLDAAKLADAKGFVACSKRLRSLLVAQTKTTYLAGHNVTYDAGRLAYEFTLLGQEVPEMVLLDTKLLGPLAGIGSSSSSLADFAAAIGLTNPAPHEATADALTTREVVLHFIDKLISAGVSDLSPYAVLPLARTTYEDSSTIDLEPEHLALHGEPLIDRVAREKALAQCLAWSCPVLHRRIEDGVTNAASARSLVDWSVTQLERRDLTRYQLGLLAAGALRAIRGRRELAVNPKPDLMVTSALRVLSALPTWALCEGDDQCDKCANAKPESCRFVVTPTRLVWASLYSKDDQVPRSVAAKYLFGAQTRPLGKLSTYDRFREIHPDAALRGAVVAARTLRSLGDGPRAMVAVKALWHKDRRTPGLTEIYAAIEEDNPSGGTLIGAIGRARAVCDDASRHASMVRTGNASRAGVLVSNDALLERKHRLRPTHATLVRHIRQGSCVRSRVARRSSDTVAMDRRTQRGLVATSRGARLGIVQ
jgi:DNA polymerase III epsilon subunit-like protein